MDQGPDQRAQRRGRQGDNDQSPAHFVDPAAGVRVIAETDQEDRGCSDTDQPSHQETGTGMRAGGRAILPGDQVGMVYPAPIHRRIR